MSKQQRGHHPLNLRERELISQIESCSEHCADLCRQLGSAALHDAAAPADLRWLRIGEDHLQQGLMALTRAVARPDAF